MPARPAPAHAPPPREPDRSERGLTERRRCRAVIASRGGERLPVNDEGGRPPQGFTARKNKNIGKRVHLPERRAPAGAAGSRMASIRRPAASSARA